MALDEFNSEEESLSPVKVNRYKTSNIGGDSPFKRGIGADKKSTGFTSMKMTSVMADSYLLSSHSGDDSLSDAKVFELESTRLFELTV